MAEAPLVSSCQEQRHGEEDTEERGSGEGGGEHGPPEEAVTYQAQLQHRVLCAQFDEDERGECENAEDPGSRYRGPSSRGSGLR